MKRFVSFLVALLVGGEPGGRNREIRRKRRASFATFKFVASLLAIGAFLLIAYSLSGDLPAE